MTVLTSPTLTPEPMVVALNGIFDVYADETSPWDVEVFRKGNFLEGLKGVVGKVRAIVRMLSLSLSYKGRLPGPGFVWVILC